MRILLRILYGIAAVAAMSVIGLGLAAIGAYYYVAPSLPDVESLREVRLQVPMRVYTRDGLLLAEFGEQRRIPLEIDEIPARLQQAFLAAEDDRFFEHPGVDWQGLTRAAVAVALTGEPTQGGGTITMQVARNFFLGREKTISRKVREILLALRIEHILSKEEILSLYLNKIFLGQRAYGVGAAAEVYFGKTVHELTTGEIALIAGTGRLPSLENPVSGPERARQRRAYVLRRMLETGVIDAAEMEAALAEPVVSRVHGAQVEVRAPWVAEMARNEMLNRVGPEAYTAGYAVVTSIDSRLQPLAQHAVRAALEDYDRRHGYRGPLATLPAPPADPAEADLLLEGYPEPAGLRAAVVLAVDEAGADMHLRGTGPVRVPFEGMRWARSYIDEDRRGPEPETPADVVAPGHVVLLDERDSAWALAQVPAIQGALTVLDPRDGAVVALSGGLDFELSKFNRAIQARRQPGSAFKPFVYSAALERGLTAASIEIDAPVVYDDPQLEDTWRPQNYTGRFYGPMRLREALVNSRNLVSIRVLERIGISAAAEHISDFGFPPEALPRDLTLALGSGGVTPLELATGYAAFANGGFRVEPYFIDRIYGPENTPLYESQPAWACPECEYGLLPDFAQSAPEDMVDDTTDAELPPPVSAEPPPRAVEARNAWIIASMLEDVIRRGTGVRARALERSDLAGKTGTTNDGRDTWFAGFNGDLVATAWVGFDQERPLGRGETGASTALPMWIEFMGPALEGAPPSRSVEPPGLMTVRISAETGRLARAGEPGTLFETFRVGHVPPAAEPGEADFPDGRDRAEEDRLF
ncbi:penicillin-binding protein 1A [Wenzhouxiangella sp. XN24]|uniref:penicillin-binding protein 1A n=1 Tax=Wenzhouxiangella sp. XN24 TaxID=2713569 RepID=UPI0013EDB299|nr:penicillin-binding protein 1A [Wenzhouxiangella sp. XN24]NGX17445.1 penicillin-binding protein 1A [Wenzhouxiangella sp. XN24]